MNPCCRHGYDFYRRQLSRSRMICLDGENSIYLMGYYHHQRRFSILFAWFNNIYLTGYYHPQRCLSILSAWSHQQKAHHKITKIHIHIHTSPDTQGFCQSSTREDRVLTPEGSVRAAPERTES
jgi:hypothetical protein